MTTTRAARGGDHAPDYVHAKHMYDLQAVRVLVVVCLCVCVCVCGNEKERRESPCRLFDDVVIDVVYTTRLSLCVCVCVCTRTWVFFVRYLVSPV